MMHSPALGAFIRSDIPLTIPEVAEIYHRPEAQMRDEVWRMVEAGHLEPSPYGTTFTATQAGREAWHSTDDDE